MLNGAAVKTLAGPEVRERLIALASPPVGDTPAFLREQVDKWARVIRAGNIKAD